VAAIKMGPVAIGQAKDSSFTISNVGNDTLHITSVTVPGGLFSVVPAGTVVLPGQSIVDTVRYAPTAAGADSAFVIIISNAPSSPDTLHLKGSGVLVTGVAYLEGIPEEYSLSQNYPNPFNPSTTIRFGLPVRSRVTIDVYNMLGQLVLRILDEERGAGFVEKTWQATTASGIYIYRMVATSVDDPSQVFFQTKKMVLIR